MSGPPRHWHPLVLVAVALAAWVYWPLTSVYFYADDFVHMADLEDEGLLRFLVTPFSGHNFLVRNFVFFGMYRTVGLREDAYFWTVLATHLLNVGLLFSVIRTVTASPRLACFGAALWGTAPVAAGTLGWYSAYGHALTATLLLLVLEPLVRLAASSTLPSTRQAGWWCALLLAGTACFGTGIGSAVAFPVAFLSLFPGAWWHPALRTIFALLPIATVALWAALRAFSTLLAPMSLTEAIQNSLLVERLGAVPAMLGQLLAFGTATTLLGFFLPTGGDPGVASTVAVVMLVGGIALTVWRGDALARRTLLAMLAMLAGVYLVIAVGRSGLYAGAVSLAAAAGQPRYHYLAPAFIVVTACLALREVARIWPFRLVPGWAALSAGLGLLIYGRLQSEFVIDDHYPVRQYVLRTLHEIDEAATTKPYGSTVYLENGTSPTDLLGPVLPNSLFPGRAAVFLITHPSDTHAGRAVRFIERDPDMIPLVRAQDGRRLADLLIAPKDVPWTPWEVP